MELFFSIFEYYYCCEEIDGMAVGLNKMQDGFVIWLPLFGCMNWKQKVGI